MRIKWTLRSIVGSVVREKDHATVNTTTYGTGTDATLNASTTHGKQLWIETDSGEVVTARLNHTKNVSASPGDRVRVVFADPGAHVVGLTNVTLQTTWKWKYPAAGCGVLLGALLLLGMFVGGVIAIWRGNLAIGALLLAIGLYIVIVPLGQNRRRIRELDAEREQMLSSS